MLLPPLLLSLPLPPRPLLLLLSVLVLAGAAAFLSYCLVVLFSYHEEVTIELEYFLLTIAAMLISSELCHCKINANVLSLICIVPFASDTTVAFYG